MKKRIISLILALALCVGMLPAPAWAEEPTDPTQAVEVVGAANPSEETDPTTEPTEAETAPTEAPTEAPAAEPTPAPTEALAPETTVAPAPTEAPTEPAPTEDEAVAAVQAMIDALPDVEDMSESYLDALEAAYSAFDALSEAQQAQINGVEKLEALFNWVNSQVSTLAAEETISGEVNWNNRTLTTPVKLTGDTTLTLTGTNRIECEKPLDLNGHKLTIQGTGSLELVGSNNDGNYYNSGTIYDSTWTGTSYTGGGMVIESGTVIARADVYNAVAVRYLYMDGGKLEAYGARAGIVTTDLQIKDGSLYATGNSKCGINMYSAPRAVSVNGLNILVSNEPNAQEADMEDGTTSQIENSEPKKTVAIGKFSTSPSISVKPQQGYLYEATAKTATFALSGRNVDLSALTLEWIGTHTGLEASADGKTLTVTTDETVQAGTYRLKVSVGEASRTAVVTVSGPPICIYDRPVDTISTDPEAGEVHVSAYLTDGHSGFIAFQWKQEDGTVMEGYTGENVPLCDLVELGMLTQDASKPWLQSIRIYCTLSYDGYSLNTDTVTLGLSSCSHPAVNHEGICLQCGQKKGSDGDALLVREDGLYHLIANAEPGEANVGLFMYGGGNFYLTGDVPNKTVNVSCTDVGGKDVTLDLQEHTMKSLQMGNFPYGTFTVKNGTLKDLDTAASGKLILENILYQGKWFDEEFDLTVQGENTRFERPVTFWGTTHLRGGRFSQGLDSDCAGRALELLEDGFAFYDSADKVVDATDSARLVGREIHVAAHPTCHYRGGKCDCGRSCDHQGTTDENGYCTNCGTFVYPFAIGEKLYTGLEAALTAAQEGDTVTLRGDYDMQAATVEIKKSITLELNGHTLSGWPYAPILTILAPDVTIQNGTVKNTDTSKSSPAVQVGTLHTTGAKLTVKNAIFEGSESHGVPRNYGLSIFAGNTAQAENGTFIGGISVNGSLTLNGGKADHIYVGTGVTYASLLAKGYAYQAKGQLVKPENMADGIAVEVVKCGHPDGLTDTEACAYCGLTCNHPGIDSTTGNCTVCGLFQATASVAAGGTTTYFADFSEALEAAKAASGSTLTLFRDVALTGEKNLYIDSGTFTIDWNGHTLSGETSNALLCITDAAKVTLTDSIGTGGVRNVRGAAIGAYVGSPGSLTIQGGVYSPQLWKDRTAYGPIQISGGRFESPEDSGRNGALYCYSGSLAELLAPGYTFAYEEDDSLVDVYQRKSDIYRTVYVVEHQHEFEEGQCPCGYLCPHDEVDEEGVCTLCGKRFYVRGTYADGTTHYYGTISDALGDSAVTQATILRALTEECESWNGGGRSVTLDLNGWNLVVERIQGGHLILCDSSGIGSILAVKEIQKDGQVSVESGRLAPQGETLSVSGKLTVTGGKVDSLTAMKGSTVSLSGGYVGSLTAMEGSTVSLSGGSFGKIVGRGVTLKELLAEDRYYAELDGTPKNYADTDTVLEQVSVEPCDHTSVREDKQGYFPVYTCNCGKVRYLLTVTDGSGSVTYHSDYSKGFAYAAKCSGVVRLLEKLPNDQTITMDVNGTVAIDMSGTSMLGKAKLIIADGTTLKIVSDGYGNGWDSNFPAESITVRSGGKLILPAEGPSGGDNKLEIDLVTVEAGAQAELSGGSCRVHLWGEARISGGKYSGITVYGTENKLTVTGGEIINLSLWGGIQHIQLSGGSVSQLWVSEMDPDTMQNCRRVTFEDIQSLLAPGKAFRKADNTWLTEGDVEELTPYPGGGTLKQLLDVTIADVPMTGAAVYCQLGADTYEERVSTQYNVGETDSSGNVVFRLGVNIQSQEVQSGVTVQWYELGAEDSRTPVGTGLTCPLDLRLPVGTHRFLAVVNCSGYVLESQPFAVTITPRVVNITGGFTAQDRDYVPEDRSVRIIQGEVTFDKKAEGDDLSAQVHGGTIATPDAGQNRTVDYSVTLTGEDKDNYTLGSKSELTVTIRPIAQTLTFAETAVTKTYGDSPFVNALDHSAGDGPITYASSDPAVATVDTDGTVTILKSGTVKITAKAGATQNYVETSASFDLTVAKAAGTVTNKSYGLTYYYGYNPMPQASDFTADSTGEIHFEWTQDGKTVTPKDAGIYTLTVTVDGDEKYGPASLTLTVTIHKSSNTGKAVDSVRSETVFGKNDGLVKLSAPAENCEYRVKGETEYRNIPGDPQGKTLSLAVGTYEFRLKETKNYNPTPAETVTIEAGPKLTVTLPSPQTGYSLTADKQELGWHDSVTLTLTLETGYYPTASLAIKAGDRVFTEDKGTYTLTNVEENLTITLEGVEKDEKAPGLALRNWIFGQGVFQGMASCKEWKNISTATAPYYIISTRGNYFAVEASDGETGLASASYLLSRTALTREALEQAAWEPVPEESLNLASPDREKMIQLGLGEWYFYVKAVDKAGNVSYVGSDKLIREENAPRFGGVINGATYYTTQKVTITDDYALSRYLAPESQNWKNISGTSYEVTLEGNREGTYTMEAEDACQNTSTLTVYMKPISSLTEDIRDLTEDNVCKSDLDQLTQAEKALKALDTTNATAEEKKTITEALDHIGKLKTVLEEVTRVEAKIDALPDSVEPYQQTVEDTQIKPARQAYSDLTDHQKTLVDSTKLDKLVRLEAQLDAWTITEGDGQTWYKGSWNPLSFTVNGQTRKFSKVLLDGKMHITATPSFLAVSGSIDEPFTLTLKPEFLQVWMKPGEHTLTVIYGENNSGTGTVTFTVEIPANYLDVTGKPEFDGKTTVTVDGKEYPIEEMNGTRYVNLPETGDLLTIYSFKDGTPTGSCTNYPIGMQVFRITRQEGGAKAEEITEFANLLNYAGCSIRLTGTKGIRMITGIGENARTALTGARGLGGYTLEEYGTVVMRGVGTPTLENSKSHNFAYKKGKADPIFSRANGMIQYTNVLVGFSLEDCKDTLTLRPYIKLKDMTTGETVTLYGGCVSRSIGYIAKQNENTYKPGTAGYKYIHEIIDAVYGKTEQGGETK